MPVNSLVDILTPAFAPCRNFQGICQGMKWAPEKGYIPRGFGGANGELDEVRLVIVTAEPGNPAAGEEYMGSSSQMVGRCLSFFEELFQDSARDRRGSQFFRNLRTILNLCWPDHLVTDQLRLTWFTNAVKCSAETSGGKVPQDIERACVFSYLKRELQLFPNAYVLALGNKAKVRLGRVGISPNGVTQHPSARPVTDPLGSWKVAAEKFRAWLR